MLRKSDYRYLARARQVALLSDFRKIHVGCVAVYQNNIIGIGCNTNKTHPNQEYYNKYRKFNLESIRYYPAKLHAEINCINQIRHMNINFGKVNLYIYRVRNDRPYSLARPCPSCMHAILDLGIKNIYYTTNSGYAHERLMGGDTKCASIA